MYVGKTKRADDISQNVLNTQDAFSGTIGDLNSAKQLSGKRMMFGKKKANKYLYTWKKAKTTIRTFRYDKKTKKWKKSAKEVPTTYLIYAKKNGKYQQIATTKAKKIVTKYKNIKISPMSEWKAE